jgi:putative ABC transport system permease protein
VRLRRVADRPDLAAPPTRLRLADAIRSTLDAISARPGRSVLTASGTVLGMAALVASIGLTATARYQISDAFDSVTLDELKVRAIDSGSSTEPFAGSALRRLAERADVKAVGVLHTAERPVAIAVSTHHPPQTVVPSVVDAEMLKVVQPTLRNSGVRTHRWGDGGSVLLSRSVADTLPVSQPLPSQVVFVAGRPMAVAGVFDDVTSHSGLLLGVIIDPRAAEAIGIPWRDTRVVVAAPRRAQNLAADLPLVLAPYDPASLQVSQLPAPERLRQQVDDSVGRLLLLLAVLALTISGLGIANTTLTAVIERQADIGLRRALGARRRHVAALTVLEGGLLGLAGAIVGVWLGMAVTVGASLVLRWQPVLEAWPLWFGPLVGLSIGVVAGVYPALRAAKLQPADVLRR